MSHILEVLDLVDTPNTYAGVPGRPVRVNDGATALVFSDVAAAYSSLDTSTFNGILSASEDDVQAFAELFDDLELVDLNDVDAPTLVEGDYLRWFEGTSKFQPVNLQGLEYFFNGTFKESFNALETSDGATITLSLEQSGGGDLTMKFSDGLSVLDCTPAATIALTAGSDTTPTTNYIYIPQSTKVLTKSTSSWPSGEHIKVAFLLVPSATKVQNDSGAYINQNWNDHRAGTDNQGHLAHICQNIRLTMGGANWASGVAPNATGSEYLEIVGTTPSAVYWKSTAGVAQQMHPHTIPAKDMSTGDDCHIVNDPVTPYLESTDLGNDITADANGISLSNKWFNLVFWMACNKTGQYEPLFCNLPTGSYTSQSLAEADTSGYDVTSLPREFVHESSTGFLVCRITCKRSPTGDWTLGSTKDLRGIPAGASAGGGGGGGALTEFPDNLFSIYNVSDDTKVVDWDLSGLTTGNTRTITPSDADMTLLSTTEYTDLTDGGNTTLHTHDHGNMDGLADDDHPHYALANGSRTFTGSVTIDTGAAGNAIFSNNQFTSIGSAFTGRIYNQETYNEIGFYPNGGATYDSLRVVQSARPQWYNNAFGAQNLALQSDLTSYLPLTAGAGNALTGDLHLTTSDIVLDNDAKIGMDAYLSGTRRDVLLVDATGTEGTCRVGNVLLDAVDLRGAATRPTYNDSDLALRSDIGTDAPASHTHTESDITDLDILLSSAASEIDSLTNITSPEEESTLVMEDAGDSGAKKRLKLKNIGYGLGGRLRLDDNADSSYREYIASYTDHSNGQAGATVIYPWGKNSVTDALGVKALIHLNFTNTAYNSGALLVASGLWSGGTTVWDSTKNWAEWAFGRGVTGVLSNRVRFGYDASNYPCIVIGATTDTTSALGIRIDLQGNRSSTSSYDMDNMVVERQTSLTGFTFQKDFNGAYNPFRLEFSSQVAGMTEDTGPASGDWFMMERAEGGLRKVDFDNMPGGGSVTAPKTTAITADGTSASYNSGVWQTLAEETSGGPFLIHHCYIYSTNTGSSVSTKWKFTVDGTVIHEYSTINKSVNPDDVIYGLGSIFNHFGVFFARSSFKIECQVNSSGAAPIYVYTSYQTVSIS